MWLENDGKVVSFWHDVPVYPVPEDRRIINMVVEIPRWTDGKIEIKRSEPMSKFLGVFMLACFFPHFRPAIFPHLSHIGIVWVPILLRDTVPDSINADPIFHDDKNKLPRFVESVWPHRSYPFLYGSIPQTWESPNFNHDFTDFPGDNDPIDVFDIGLE